MCPLVNLNFAFVQKKGRVWGWGLAIWMTEYHIFLIKGRGYYYFMYQSAAATIQGRPQFEGGYYYTSVQTLVLAG